MTNHYRYYSSSQQNSDFVKLKDFFEATIPKDSITFKTKTSLIPFFEKVYGANTLDAIKEKFPKIIKYSNEGNHEKIASFLQSTIHELLPLFCTSKNIGIISPPFHLSPILLSQALKDLIEDEKWVVNLNETNLDLKPKLLEKIANALLSENEKNRPKDTVTDFTLALENSESNILKFIRFSPIYDYLKIKRIEEKPLKNSKLDGLLFEGIVINTGTDITQTKILQLLESFMVTDESNVEFSYGLQYISQLVRSFLDLAEIDFGSIYVQESSWHTQSEWTLLRKFDQNLLDISLKNASSFYKKCMEEGQCIFGELYNPKNLQGIEKKLFENGYRSLLLFPVFDEYHKVLGLIELASEIPNRFNKNIVHELIPFVKIFEMGMRSFMKEIDNQVQLVIQEKFTAIHQSVKWKFEEIAGLYYWNKTSGNEEYSLQAISFPHVYPLYAQADIVGSSKLRKHCVLNDIRGNIKSALAIFHENFFEEALNTDVGDYIKQLNIYLTSIDKEGSLTNEKELIVFLRTTINPFIKQYASQLQNENTNLQSFIKEIDNDLGIFNSQQNNFKTSVELLNNSLFNFVENENTKLQKETPHYYEGFKTDGVEHTLYAGQSILQQGTFLEKDLEKLRYWQLETIVEMTLMVSRLKKQISIPLETAQLILAYNDTLSIRFKEEEKQFDVDGTYNIRHEVIKKRLDKIKIKETDERLTTAGTISIVYLDVTTKQTYIDLLKRLKEAKGLNFNIENLQLENISGAEGLAALRLNII